MARIRGKRVPGAPGWRTRGLIPSLGSGRVTRESASKSGIRRLFARDPSKGAFVNVGTEKDVLGQIVPAKNASFTSALAGANNDMKFLAKPAGVVGNAYRVQIVVSGASTPLSVSVSGTDLTINSATNGASAAISTANDVLAAIKASATVSAKFEASLAPGNDGTGVVAALAFQTLTGGAEAVGQHADVPGETGPQSPSVQSSSEILRSSTRRHKNVVSRATNRRIRKR